MSWQKWNEEHKGHEGEAANTSHLHTQSAQLHESNAAMLLKNGNPEGAMRHQQAAEAHRSAASAQMKAEATSRAPMMNATGANRAAHRATEMAQHKSKMANGSAPRSMA